MKVVFIALLMITHVFGFLPNPLSTIRSSRPRFATTDAEDAAYAEETALFDQIDADGDGGIDNREMTAALSRMGILGPEMQTIALSKVAVPETSSAEVNQMFSDADGNGDGIIDFAEFATIYKKIKAMAATKNTR
mmetsp:Transcript_68430/g.137616  ORF Transcript_68430/g.137616 Transcript_68430/m.137616 type:complete len:135 (+) Transcript_68430:91-495(+)